MRSISPTCASTLSALALATLPGHREADYPTRVHPDFTSASGYIKRVVAGEVIHAVDWDGRPGVDSLFREEGRRSRGAWLEFREWGRSHREGSLRVAGVKACEVLLKHYGPYDPKTSEALEAKRGVRREREELLKRLDDEFPLTVRCAAREYLHPQLFTPPQLPSFPSTPSIIALPLGFTPSGQAPYEPQGIAPEGGSLAQAEDVLRRHMDLSTPSTSAMSVEDYAREVLKKIQPIETHLDVLDVTEGLMRLPPIPGEEEPADMDRIGFGHLICRHRAVIVALLLADAGYKIELVRGTVEQEGGYRGGHLFIYGGADGILEASASGPEFWRSVESTWQEREVLALKAKDGAVYRCEHRTSL